MRLAIPAIIAVAIPALEIVGIYLVGSRIGFGWTLLWLLVAIYVGMRLILVERVLFLPRLLQAVQQNQSPFPMIWASGRRFFAGVLLMIPGPFSDVIALLLLLWPGTRSAAGYDSAYDSANTAEADPRTGRTPRASMPHSHTDRKPSAEVIEGEFRRED
jgi:UPF0716 protein FxsA